MPRILTVGHGTMPADQFAVLLRGASVSEVVDVRSYPWSRHNPQFGWGEMARWLPESGIAYSWLEDLGGRRRGSSGQPRSSSPGLLELLRREPGGEISVTGSDREPCRGDR